MSASSAGAQIVDSSAAAHPTNVWLSVSLGPARTELTAQGLIAGQIALWGSRDRLVMAIRRSGGSDLDTRDEYDSAVLVGVRTAPAPFMAVAAIGPAIVTNDPASGPRRSEVGLGAAAELSANLRYVGVGVSVFGAAGSSHRFAGIGFTAELGKIR
jgi:hypothetical protein